MTLRGPLWWLHSLEELWSLHDFTLRLHKATPLWSHRGPMTRRGIESEP